MDFRQEIPRYPLYNTALPYYMTYSDCPQRGQDQAALRDLEYLQQAYPDEVKRYQGRVMEMLDKMDYEGSMIYDEYPDRYGIARLAGTITEILQRDEAETGDISPERKMWMENLIRVLLCNEIYRRRRGGRRGSSKYGMLRG